jgi:hypothetical protein
LESDIRAYEDAIDARRVAVPDRAASLLQPPETAPAPATPEPVAGTSRLKPDEAAPAAPAAMAKSNGRGRKRGPKGGYKTASQVAEIVARVAPGGDWKDKLGESCSALDRAELPYPKTWPKRDLPLHSWEDGATLEPGLAKKAIEYWLKAAKLRKNPDPETLS